MKLVHLSLFLLFLLVHVDVSAQCGTSGETLFLENQEDINAIMNCDSIFGSLSISNWDISSLDSLSNLNYIEEDFILIDNTALLNIEALENLQFIGGDMVIENNFTLQYFDGLENLNHIGGDVYIRGNITLIDIDGLSGISQINGDLIIEENHTLENLDGLLGVQHVNGDVRLEDLNSILNDLNGLASIIGIDGSLYISLPSATTIDGFDALQAVEGTITLENMDLLASISGLNSLVEIGTSLHIENNSNLVSLNGLENLMSITENLEVLNNPALFHCCGIEHLLDNSVGGSILIENNAIGCNSGDEIILDCFVHVDQLEDDNFKLYTSNHGIELSFNNSNQRDVSVYDSQGRRLNYFLNISDETFTVELLDRGFYIVTVIEEGKSVSRTIIR